MRKIHRRAGDCDVCHTHLIEVDESVVFPWRIVGWTVGITTVSVTIAVMFPLFSTKITTVRNELKLQREVKELTVNRAADERVRSVIQANLAQALRLAETILGRETRLRSFERALSDAPVQSATSRDLYRDATAKLERAITDDLRGYHEVLTSIYGQTIVISRNAAAVSRLPDAVLNPARRALDDLEAASDLTTQTSRQIAFQILRSHVESADARVPSPADLRELFVSSSKKFYDSLAPKIGSQHGK